MNRETQTSRMRRGGALLIAALACGLAAVPAAGNHLQIANTAILQATVQFDIAWENSWRHDGEAEDDGYFHDAVWVFFKVRVVGEEAWRHVRLAASGTTPTGFDTGSAGGLIELRVPEDRMGVFVRRSAAGAGSGAVASTAVQVRWDPAASGIAMGQTVDMRTFGVEMVHVADGPFWVGDGITGFTRTLIHTNDATVAPVSVENEWQGGYPRGQTVPDSPAWPNGHDAFYCMKYLVTQGQYTDFLNSLTPLQASLRAYTGGDSRNTISVAGGVYAAAAPDRACNYLSWTDHAAFAAWAALRPMSELEFEKACRGPLYPVPGEYAWGTDTIATNILQLSGVEDGSETVTNDVSDGAAIAFFTRSFSTLAMRVGLFATNGADRISAGASYWGIMELSGHLCERAVAISYVDGRAFRGTHGDGELHPTDATALNEDWSTTGQVNRGLGWHSTHGSSTYLRVSNRNTEAKGWARQPTTGARAVRTAPVDFP